LLSSRTIAAALDKVHAAKNLSPDVRSSAAALLQSNGVTFVPPTRASPAEVTTLRRIFVEALASGARWPLLFSCVTGAVAVAISFFIPHGLIPDRSASVDDETRLAASH
jgi:hypothetical protein